jgi:hypothetical protein
MDIRKMALVMALPLALGIGCSTSGSNRTASAEGTAPAPAGTSATTQGSPGSTGNDAEGGAQTSASPGQAGVQGDTTYGAGSDLKGHASDQVVMGTVASVSSGSLSIASDMGAAKTLHVVPETIITVGGRDGRIADIKEGEQIRASFNEQDGRQVAVKIDAGPMTGGHMGTTGTGTGTPTDMGAPGSSSTGSSSTSDTGTSSGSTGTSGTGTGGGY